jgi:hypothetical protein
MTQTKDFTMTDDADPKREVSGAVASRFELPDWAPPAVVGALVTFGLLGGLGIIPVTLPSGLRQSAGSPSPVEEPAKDEGSSKGPRVTLKERQAGNNAPAPAAAPSPAGSGAEATISVAHLVVAHNASLIGQAKSTQRTRDEARKRAEEALARARKGEDFGKLVAEYSDEANAATRLGKFKGFRRTDAIQPFGDTAYALKPGEISDVIETKLGFHVIRRD